MDSVSKILNIKKVCWTDVRTSIKAINPNLFKILDKISPSKDFSFYKAVYPFGCQILKNGKFFLPAKNSELIDLADSRIEKNIREDLSYNFPTTPVFITLKKSLELFMTLHDRVIPYFLINPGNMYGVWKVLDKRANRNVSHAPYSIWDITSGARSIFMLPKISEKNGHNRLQKEFNFTLDKPEDLRDHWKIFTAIASSENCTDKWESEVLFFSKKWFENLDDPALQEFTLYLLDFNWACTEYWRSQYSWYLAFSRIHSTRNITPNPYHADIIKHLLAISVGALPGFSPATNDDLGPITSFQKIYAETYRLPNWAPIIMQPQSYNMHSPTHPVYYSLQYPSAIELSPSANKRASVVEDAHMTCALLEKYLQDLASGRFNIDSTTLQEIAHLVKFDFFHSDVKDYSKLRDNKLLPKSDIAFLEPPYKGICLEFPHNSTFFKGCIRIYKK